MIMGHAILGLGLQLYVNGEFGRDPIPIYQQRGELSNCRTLTPVHGSQFSIKPTEGLLSIYRSECLDSPIVLFL